MSYREFELTMPTGYTEDDLRQALAKLTGLRDFSYHILLKSLDARRKDRIVWRFRCAVNSAELQVEAGSRPEAKAPLVFADSGRGRRVLVVGTGPAGIFSALYLARCGFAVQVVERGSTVEQRRKALQDFEQGAAFPTANNYAFGEGGAGTFSDGKLSSRTKGISSERDFIFETLIAAGAPTEIAYMTHPHVGSDLLFGITSRLRETLMEAGVQFSFDTVAEDLLLTG
ncbi:MAG: FAD-dependent monooxygenase, partial [Spirochaetes bacterium]|nr:FAD-dependent monooxygenase [Spirochaetota bacterium]